MLALAGALALNDRRMREILVYMAPLFLAGPLWIRLRLRTADARPAHAQALDAAVVGLSVARLLTGTSFLPFSGHTLFLSYVLLVTPRRAWRLSALLLLLFTTAFKVWLWGDVASWGWGIAVGVAAALLHPRREP